MCTSTWQYKIFCFNFVWPKETHVTQNNILPVTNGSLTLLRKLSGKYLNLYFTFYTCPLETDLDSNYLDVHVSSSWVENFQQRFVARQNGKVDWSKSWNRTVRQFIRLNSKKKRNAKRRVEALFEPVRCFKLTEIFFILDDITKLSFGGQDWTLRYDCLRLHLQYTVFNWSWTDCI